MRVKVYLAVIPILVGIAIYLQGCSTSEDIETPAGSDDTPNLSLATTSGTTVLVADGVSSVPVQLTLTNAAGRGVANTPVTFTTTAGTLLANGENTSVIVNTNSNGVAQAILRSSTTIETATVRAEAMGFSVGIEIQFVGGPPTTLLLTATPRTVNARETSTIEATARDDSDNPASGVPITFTLSTNASGASLNLSSGITAANGRVSVTYTAGPSTGRDVIRAETNGISATVAITVVADVTPPGNVASITVTSGASHVPANGSATTTITATLLDANGRFVSDGTLVNFATDLGTITSQATTTNGVARATFTAGTVAGNATVTASSGNISTPAVISLDAGPAASIIVSSVTNTSIAIQGSGSNDTSTLTFQVRDSNGNLVPDPNPSDPATATRINFTLENGGLGGGEGLNPLQTIVVNGRVITTLQSGTIAGPVRVVAFVDANDNGTFNGGEVASEAIRVVITGGSPWGEDLSVVPEVLNIAGLVTFGLTDQITTFLSDRFSNPVPDGTAVFFFTNFGGVTGSAVSDSAEGTTASTAPAVLTSQAPSPPDGFVTVTAATQSGKEARILALAVAPDNPALIYAGTDGGGVFRTPNGLVAGPQVAWEQLGAPRLLDRRVAEFTSGIVRDLQIDPSDSSIIYAATEAGVFRSTGGGDAWEERSGRERVEGRILGQLEEDPFRPGFFSPLQLPFPSDGSRARTVVQINGVETTFYTYEGAQAIDVLPAAGSATGDLVTISYDLGAFIPRNRSVTAIILDPSDLSDPASTRTLYASTRGEGVFRSRDGGFSWRNINNGLTNFNVLSLIALSPTTLYAGTSGGGVFRTLNANANVPIWCRVSNGLRNASVINTLATDGTRLYAGTLLAGMAILEDATPPAGITDCRQVGTSPTWRPPNTRNVNARDVLNTFVTDIVIDPTNPATLYATTLGDGTRSIEDNAAQGGVFVSRDSGETWNRVPALPANELGLPPNDLPDNRAYSLSIAAPDTIYIGTAGRSVVRLTPSTATYTVINGTPDNALTNNIFDSTTVLFSGNTGVTITQVADIFQDQNRIGFGPLPDGTIFNTGAQTFIYTVSDQNGNPITSGSTVEVTLDPSGAGAELVGDVSFTIPDTQRGSTNFAVSVINNREESGNEVVAITINVTSAPNGDVTASAVRTLIGPVTLIADSGTTLPGRGGTLSFSVIGGSETPAPPSPIDGGYIISEPALTTIDPDPPIISFGQSFTLTTTALTQGQILTLRATDRITGQSATIDVTQEQTPPVAISPPTATLPAGGGQIPFTVSGGSDTTYSIRANPVGTVNPATVPSGGSFTLTTNATVNGLTITVSARDTITNQIGQATITQAAPATP